MTSKTKKPEMAVISGCFQGLSCLMVNYTQSYNEGNELFSGKNSVLFCLQDFCCFKSSMCLYFCVLDDKPCAEIFKYMMMAIDPAVNHTRYEMPLAGLELLARHAPQFGPLLLQDYRVCIKS